MNLKNVYGFLAAMLAISCTAFADEAKLKSDSSFEKDRQAILAMAGAYHVKFQFEETVALRPDYKLHEPHVSDANEWVEVVEDSGNRIVLQHILALEDRVVKHWRQEWEYENRSLLEFRGNSRWEKRNLTPEQAAGTWTQRVFQVDDSPRYEGFGKWVHLDNLVYWESNETWRPLPRREYTTRSDYDVLVARNRHMLTPTGWVHEQDNFKLVLDPAKLSSGSLIARELGLNTYDRVDPAVVATAQEYWKKSHAFWSDVRSVWTEQFASHSLELRKEVDDKPMHRLLFDYCDDVAKVETYDSAQSKTRIREIIQKFVVVSDAG